MNECTTTITIARADAAGEDARWCLRQYFAELAERFETGYDPGQSLPFTPDDFTPPRGVFLLATDGGERLGCGSFTISAPGVAYIKRMWVAPQARGAGLGRRILDALEAEAAGMGLATAQLETNRALPEAIGLYRSRGYRQVPPFNDEPYADFWFSKPLPRPA